MQQGTEEERLKSETGMLRLVSSRPAAFAAVEQTKWRMEIKLARDFDLPS